MTKVESDVRQAIAAAVATYGKLDGAFNNSGVYNGTPHVMKASVEDFDAMMQVNLRGVFLCLKYEISQMMAQGGGGAIVNCGSSNTLRAAAGQSLQYTASKHAEASCCGVWSAWHSS